MLVEVKCSACGSAMPADSRFCPNCGAVLVAAAMNIEPVVIPVPPLEQPQQPQSTYVKVEQPRDNSSSANWGAIVGVMGLGLVALGLLAAWNFGLFTREREKGEQPAAVAGSEKQQPAAMPDMNIDIQMPPNQAPPASTPDINVTLPPAATPPATPPPSVPPAPPAQPVPGVEVVSISAEATDKLGADWTYRYIMKVRNNTSGDIRRSFHIEYLDAQGFVVDDDLLENVVVPANTELEFQETDTVRAEDGPRIRTVRAEPR